MDMPTIREHQDFWTEIAEDCAQLDTVLQLIDDAPGLLGDLGDQTFGIDHAQAVCELSSALFRVRHAAIDRLQRLKVLKDALHAQGVA